MTNATGGLLRHRQGLALVLTIGLIAGLVFLGPLGSLSPTSPLPTSEPTADSYNADPAPDDAATIEDVTIDDVADVPVDGSSEEPAASQTTTTVADTQTTTTVAANQTATTAADSQTTTAMATSDIPTVVVAASNSSNKADADYVCDGSSDQVQINAAIDDLPSSGGLVQLLDGSYYIGSSSYVDLSSAVTLKGQGTATILVKSSPSGGSRMMYARSSTAPHANVCISSLRVNLGSPSSTAFLLDAYDADYLTLEDVQFTCSSRHGMITIRDSNHVAMGGCIFDGIQIQVSGETSSSAKDDTKINSEDVLVQGCTFRNSPAGEFALGNVVKKWRIINNYFYDCGFTAIDIANSPDSIISGNTIDGCAHNGIYSEGGRRLTVKDNILSDVEDVGILSNMDIYGYGQGGDVLIQNNVLADCDLAIASFGVPRMTITGNAIDGTIWHAIYLNTSTVYGVEYHPDDCVIYDNQVSDFGQQHSYSAGIALINCEGCQIHTNVIDGDYNTYAANGIKEGGDADYNTIYKNTITGVRIAAIKTVGDHTAVNTFPPTTSTTAPGVPTLKSPASWKATNDSTPTLDWSDVTSDSTVHYQLQVDDSSSFSSPVVSGTWVSSSEYTLTSSLSDGTYYWRVRAVDEDGDSSAWTSSSAFRVDTVAPAAPSLTSPAVGAHTGDTTPTLNWSDVTHATSVHYQLQVDDSSSFSSPVVSRTWVSSSQYTLTSSLSSGTYYWRVRAIDSAGNAGAWTIGWSFIAP